MGSSIINDQDRMYLGYALGKAYEDIKAYDKSFENLKIGNSLKRAASRFSIDEVKATVDEIIETFSKDVFENTLSTQTEHSPIFIIGMPRSGTTLVEQIIASHSEVIGGGELTLLRDVITGHGDANISVVQLSKSGKSYPEGVLTVSASDLSKMGQAYMDLAAGRLGTTGSFTDKMPRNFFFAGLIKLILPDAKVIHCKRSPLDTCLSCYSIHFPYGQEFSNDLSELGQYYREYDRLMAHWKSVLGDWVLDVEYENLVTDPKSGTERLLNFCELPWQDACLEFHKTDRQVTTASAAQVRQPIYKSAMKRWQHFDQHLGPLIDALGPLADIQ